MQRRNPGRRGRRGVLGGIEIKLRFLLDHGHEIGRGLVLMAQAPLHSCAIKAQHQVPGKGGHAGTIELQGQVGEITGDQMVSLTARSQQVHGNHGELS